MTLAASDAPLTKEDHDRVRGLAHRLAKQMGLLHAVDDLIGIGYQAHVQARRDYDPSREVPFGAWAYRQIRFAIIDAVPSVTGVSRRNLNNAMGAPGDVLVGAAADHAEAKPPRDVHEAGLRIDAVIGNLVGGVALADAIEPPKTPEAELDEAQQAERVRRAVAALPDREKRVVHAIWFEGKRLEDIAPQLGISVPTACRVHASGLGLLEQSLGSAAG